MRIAWFGLAAGTAVLTVSACGTLGLVGIPILAAWSEDKVFPSEPSRFRVGGTITGLSGSVTLELNGTEKLIRSENGPFSFESQVEDQSEFAVRVMEVPPDESCTLKSELGVVNGRNVDSVQLNCTSRLYSISGVVTNLNGELELRINGNESLSITSGGPFKFRTTLPKGHSYEVSVATQPRGHQCSISSGARGTVVGEVESIRVSCRPFFRLNTYQSSIRVLGHAAPDSKDSSPEPRSGTMAPPWGNAATAKGKFYVSDRGFDRILVFDGVPTQDGADATSILALPDSPDSAWAGFDGPQGLSANDDWLAVADAFNHRILLYPPLPGKETRPAIVLGQSDFGDTAYGGCSRRTLGQPGSVFITPERLIVADTGHHRVLVWNMDSLASGKPADLVIGQQSFDRCAPNDRDGDNRQDSPSDSTLSLPEGVWTDGQRLLIADFGNNRVLFWDEFPTRNGQPANLVLGQADPTSRINDTKEDKMHGPIAVTSTGEQVFVADYWNNRVLVWDRFPTASGTPAKLVLGQRDLDSKVRPEKPSNQSLDGPTGLLLAAPHLLVTDSGNNRLLIYQSN